MSIFLVSQYFKNKTIPSGDFHTLRELKISLVNRHGGAVLTLFEPRGQGDPGVPDEIHIFEFPSVESHLAFQSDPAQASLSDLQNRSLTDYKQYLTGTVIPQESMLETVISKRPAIPAPVPEPTELLRLDLTRSFSRLGPQESHPAQHLVELDTVILHPETETQKKLSRLVQKWQASNDRRVIFAHTYYLMTTNMLQALRGGQFSDKDWVSSYLNTFADYYFSALDRYERARYAAPPIWRVAFEVAKNDSSFVAQHLLLGVNAHINFDLVLTLVQVLKDSWHKLSPEEKKSRYQDHTLVNKIIEVTFDDAQALVIARYSPTLEKLNKVSFDMDSLIISSLVSSWREQAWNHAVDYLEARDKDTQRSVIQETEYIALRRADLIMLKQGSLKDQILF